MHSCVSLQFEITLSSGAVVLQPERGILTERASVSRSGVKNLSSELSW